MNPVTCSLSNIKIEEPKLEEHIICTTFLKISGDVNSENVREFFEMAIDPIKSRAAIYDIRNEKTHAFWMLYLSTKTSNEKFDEMPGNPNRLGDLMNYLTPQFYNFLQ